MERGDTCGFKTRMTVRPRPRPRSRPALGHSPRPPRYAPARAPPPAPAYICEAVQLYGVYDIVYVLRARPRGPGGRGRVWGRLALRLYAIMGGVRVVCGVCDDETCYTLHNPRQRAKLFLLPQVQLLERRLRRGRPAGRAPRPPAFPLRP